MIEDLSTDYYWYLVTIDDRFLTGNSIVKMLKLIQEVEKSKYLIQDNILGFSEKGVMESLTDNVDKIYKLESIFGIIDKIDHLEWGDFFLFKDYPSNWKNPRGEVFPLYPYVIAQSDITLRAVDDQYMYIYTQSRNFIEVVKSHYAIESIKLDLLEKLDFPD